MAFDPTQLPGGKWLKLSEVVYCLAFEELFDEKATLEAEYPSDRAYGAEIEATLERCLNEALSNSNYAAFVKLFVGTPSSSRLSNCESSWPPSGKKLYDLTVQSERAYIEEREEVHLKFDQTMGRCIEEALTDPRFSAFLKVVARPCGERFTIVPRSKSIRECEAAWPPSGARLHELVEKWEQGQSADEAKLTEAVQVIHNLLASGEVTFKGARDGQVEVIDVCLFGSAPKIEWVLGTIEAPSDQWGRDVGHIRRWTGVRVERASLIAWHKKASAPPMREKKRRGRPPRYTPECEAAARRIAAEKKASTKPSDKTDTALIEAFQDWHKNKYPDEPEPVRQTVRDWLSLWGL
jgi:hypothetical protein